MVLTTLVALLPYCAPAIDGTTALRLIQAESAGSQFAININGPFRLSRKAANYHEFRKLVLELDAAGYNFDFGFAQANNRELKRRGYAVEEYIDPCSNLKFMQEVLSGCFQDAPAGNGVQHRIAYALSCYNTGRYGPGFANGYVRRVWRAVPVSASVAYAVIPAEKLPYQLKETPL